jgi:hypothetical protein
MFHKAKTLIIAAAIGGLTLTAGAASGSSARDRGCSDAKSGSYDRSGNAGKAYEDGWNACHNGGGEKSAQAAPSEPSKKAKKACAAKFGGKSSIKTVSALKPSWWEIILTGKKGRQVACTVDDSGKIGDWVEM